MLVVFTQKREIRHIDVAVTVEIEAAIEIGILGWLIVRLSHKTKFGQINGSIVGHIDAFHHEVANGADLVTVVENRQVGHRFVVALTTAPFTTATTADVLSDKRNNVSILRRTR